MYLICICSLFLYTYVLIYLTGKVYKGLNERTGELLAVKQLYLSDSNEADIETIQEEINVICGLDHVNIVK